MSAEKLSIKGTVEVYYCPVSTGHRDLKFHFATEGIYDLGCCLNSEHTF